MQAPKQPSDTWLNPNKNKFGIIYEESGEWKIWTSNAFEVPSKEVEAVLDGLFAAKLKLDELKCDA